MLLVRSGWASLGALAVASLACSRTTLREVPDSDVAPTVCQVDADCRGADACKIRVCNAGLCETAQTISCDDGDPCTSDSCNSADGTCSNQWRTGDEDRDGYLAPLPGQRADDAAACGNDCNDSSALAYPGAVERCDGVDNDCNGIIDDAHRYYGLDAGFPAVTRVPSGALVEATPAGMAYDGQKFGMTLVEHHERWQGVFRTIATDGTSQTPAESITLPASDSLAGPLLWTGSIYGTAWEDRRDTSYDIYFNRLDINGKKLHADVRVTNSEGFSVQPTLLFDGTQWLVAYADDLDTGVFGIHVQRISKDATLVGEPMELTPRGRDARQPRLIKSENGVNLFYYASEEGRFEYLPLDAELAPRSGPVALAVDEDADLSIRWLGDRYVLAWAQKTELSVGPAIWAMAIDEAGRSIDAPRPITQGATMARGPYLVSLGDRFVLLWSDDRFVPNRFELSMQTFTKSLFPLDEQQQISNLGIDSLDPVGVLGGGTLGILFRSRIGGPWYTQFIALGCWQLESR